MCRGPCDSGVLHIETLHPFVVSIDAVLVVESLVYRFRDIGVADIMHNLVVSVLVSLSRHTLNDFLQLSHVFS